MLYVVVQKDKEFFDTSLLHIIKTQVCEVEGI